MSDLRYMNMRQFVDGGYLHEVNRLLLHPLGLALSLDVHGESATAQIWDGRDDPEGWILGDDLLSAEKAERVADEMFSRRGARRDLLGFVVQPVASERPTLTTSYVHAGGRSPQNLAPMLCQRCGNPYGFGGHGPGLCIDRREQP